MCVKAVNKYFLAFIYVPNQNKTQEMCDRAISENPFMLVYCHDRYDTQRMCDVCLVSLQFVPDWYK